ncbi:hypothetical protein HYX10_03815 [Candidatus Woesearchaeota archaeon]|nr:hypothetical protein [Candidatus Woesearchaeota archaeon]
MIATEEATEEPGEGQSRVAPYYQALADHESRIQLQKVPGKYPEKADSLMKMLVRYQGHLQERFEARKSLVHGLVYKAKKMMMTTADGSFGVEGAYYNDDMVQIVLNQGAITKQLIGSVKQARTDLKRTYAELESYRQNAASSLDSEMQEYSRLEATLEELQGERNNLCSQEKKLKGSGSGWAEALLQDGSIDLERMAVVSAIQGLDQRIAYHTESVRHIGYKQLEVMGLIHKHNGAVTHLELLAEQQAITYSVLAGALAGEESMEVAGEAIKVLGDTITSSQTSTVEAQVKIDQLGTEVESKASYTVEQAQKAGRTPGTPWDSQNHSAKARHEHVQKLRTKPISEIRAVGGAAKYFSGGSK